MIGAKSFEIDAQDFIQGMSSSNFINDGGFSSVTYGVNLTYTPGLLYPTEQPVDQTDELVANIIASCEDPRRIGIPLFRIFVDTSGNYYSWDGTLLDLLATDATNPTKYTEGITDNIGYRDDIYTTTETTISRLVLPSTLTDVFYTFATTVGPHPALVYEDNAYYGDGNLLLRQTAAGVAPSVILTLPAGQTIYALGIDPGTGKMLLSIIDGLNGGGTRNQISRVGYYDGFSNKLAKVVIVDATITVFYPVGGVLYIAYGKNFGYWTGSGIQFLRALNITLSSDKLVYKQHITNIGTDVYLVEGSKILAFGEIIRGTGKVFWYPFNNIVTPAGETDIGHIANVGSGTLAFGYVNDSSVAKFNTLSLTSVSNTGSTVFRSKKYTFPREVTFNGILTEFGDVLPTNGSSIGLLGVITDKQQTQYIPSDISGLKNTITSNYTIESTNPNIETRSIQINYIPASTNPVRRFTVFYTPKE